MLKVRFKEWDCIVQFHLYNNCRTAIELVDEKDGEPVLMATVNIPEAHIESDEVIIKNYSENEGILEVLIEAEIISGPIDYVQSDFVECPVCKLLKRE